METIGSIAVNKKRSNLFSFFFNAPVVFGQGVGLRLRVAGCCGSRKGLGKSFGFGVGCVFIAIY